MTEGKMSLEIGRFTPAQHLPPAYPARPVVASQRTDEAHRFDTVLGDVPPAPTEEVREHVDRAAEVVQQLHASNRELHFTKDDETGRVVIQVRDLDGNVLKTIPPSHALDVMSGAVL
jgi:flagellar protein FlaG